VENPEGNRKENQPHKGTHAMKQFCLHKQNMGIW